jgi:hypothetical protein
MTHDVFRYEGDLHMIPATQGTLVSGGPQDVSSLLRRRHRRLLRYAPCYRPLASSTAA